MAWQDSLEELRQLDLASLDVNNPGEWPRLVRVVAWVLVFVLALGLGRFAYLSGKLDQLERLQRQEQSLRDDFEDKARSAANLDKLRQQREQMQEAFGELLRQLPTETEVPGLLEDITDTGLDAGLKFSAIDLRSERTAEFYRELPIAITVSGTYHDLGTFVSGVANLSRIVTLHDFRITPRDGAGGRDGQLTMEIEARTYRYQDGGN